MYNTFVVFFKLPLCGRTCNILALDTACIEWTLSGSSCTRYGVDAFLVHPHGARGPSPIWPNKRFLHDSDPTIYSFSRTATRIAVRFFFSPNRSGTEAAENSWRAAHAPGTDNPWREQRQRSGMSSRADSVPRRPAAPTASRGHGEACSRAAVVVFRSARPGACRLELPTPLPRPRPRLRRSCPFR